MALTAEIECSFMENKPKVEEKEDEKHKRIVQSDGATLYNNISRLKCEICSKTMRS